MAITKDGTAATGIATGGSPTVVTSGTFTTALTNDIIVACIHNENSVLRTVSSISGGGLGWNLHKAFNANTAQGATPNDIEIWWALATGTFSATVAATLSGTTDDASIIVNAFNGCNTTTPFDTNVSIPKTASATTAAIPSIAGVSTTSANTCIIACVGAGLASTQTTQTNGAGYTLSGTTNNAGGTNTSQMGFEYQIFVSTPSNVTVPFGVSWSDWVMIATALQPAGGAPPEPLFRPSNLDGVSTGGQFFANPLARSMLGWRPRRRLIYA